MRTRGEASEVAMTSTERAMPSGPASFSMNSTTSRPQFAHQGDDVDVGPGVAGHHAQQRGFAHPGTGHNGHALPLAQGEQGVDGAHATTSSGSKMRGRLKGLGGGA